ncbi:MAG: hypothetical protein ABR592_06115 [Nitriliruptorales bacterium]
MRALRNSDGNELSSGTKPARQAFRLLTRIRTCYDGAVMYDIQLQSVATGGLIWAHSFSHEHEAERYRTEVESDLEVLDETEFRRKWRLPPNL